MRKRKPYNESSFQALNINRDICINLKSFYVRNFHTKASFLCLCGLVGFVIIKWILHTSSRYEDMCAYALPANYHIIYLMVNILVMYFQIIQTISYERLYKSHCFKFYMKLLNPCSRFLLISLPFVWRKSVLGYFRKYLT